MDRAALLDSGEMLVILFIMALGILALIETMLRILDDFGYLLIMTVSLFVAGAILLVMGVWLQREV
jgi:CHASE2 domain-containing sensor protein